MTDTLKKIITTLQRVDHFLPAVAITADIVTAIVEAIYTGEEVSDEFLATLGDESRTQEDRFAQIVAHAKAEQVRVAVLNAPGPDIADAIDAGPTQPSPVPDSTFEDERLNAPSPDPDDDEMLDEDDLAEVVFEVDGDTPDEVVGEPEDPADIADGSLDAPLG